jgi:hypothetical protein
LKVERSCLIKLTLTLTELWVLPYKGPEVAMSVCSNQMHPHLLLALCMFPLLVLIMESLLSGKDLKGLDVTVLVVQLIHPLSSISQPNHICIHTIVPQSLQSPVEGTVHHMHLS